MKTLILIIGIVLLVIGIPIWRRHRKIEKAKEDSAVRIKLQR
jgi:hypothetical protein